MDGCPRRKSWIGSGGFEPRVPSWRLDGRLRLDGMKVGLVDGGNGHIRQ